MEYTELSAYALTGGAVSVWVPTANPLGWQEDPRPPSANQRGNLEGAARGSWIGGILHLDLPLDVDALRRALREWIRRHEVLRSTFVSIPGAGGWQRSTLDPDSVDVRHTPMGHFSDQQVGAALEGFFASVCPITWPQIVFATVERSFQDGFDLAFAADHSVMDAYSQLLWYEEIFELYQWAVDVDSEYPARAVASYLDHCQQEIQLGSQLHLQHPHVSGWREFLVSDPADGNDSRLRHHSFPDPRISVADAQATQQRSGSWWLADAAECEAFFSAAKACGVGGQSAVFGMIADAVRSVSGVDRLRFVAPTHTRFDPAHAEAIGWYVGLCPLDVQLDDSDQVQLMRQVQQQWRERAGLAPLSAEAFRLLEVERGVPFAASYVDLRHVRGARDWAAQNARVLRARTHSSGELYLWVLRTFEGLNISLRYPGSEASEAVVQQLLATLRSQIPAATAALSDQGVLAS